MGELRKMDDYLVVIYITHMNTEKSVVILRLFLFICFSLLSEFYHGGFDSFMGELWESSGKWN
jgi:hypothetical protein